RRDKLGRQVPERKRPQNGFGLHPTEELGTRNAPYPLDETVVEERASGLQAVGHRRDVELHEEAVRQSDEEIERDEMIERRQGAQLREPGGEKACGRDRPQWNAPQQVALLLFVERIGAPGEIADARIIVQPADKPVKERVGRAKAFSPWNQVTAAP